MRSFLEEVVDELWEKHETLEDVILVLPSKRAGSFIKNNFATTTKKTLFSPEIYSIEGFVENISGLTKANNTQLLFELYRAYGAQVQGEKDNFYDFSKWGQLLLQDFKEVDRYLVDPNKIFSYLSEIQELNHWYLKAERTEIMKNYIRFWKDLPLLYDKFTQRLLELQIGHQGLIYRMAALNITHYIRTTPNKHYVFAGFNALNAAESLIIQAFLSKKNATIYWDIDNSFVEDKIHDAGYFVRQHIKNWNYLKEHPLYGSSNHYSSSKDIQIVGVPKNVSQAKYVGHLLMELHGTANSDLEGTAIVLGDENLLNPLLNAIPETIPTINITMGFPLMKTPLAGMFSQFFELHIQKDERGWFYKSIFAFISNSYIQQLLTDKSRALGAIEDEIKKQNWIYLKEEHITRLEELHNTPLSSVFFLQKPTPTAFVEHCLSLIAVLKEKFEKKTGRLDLEYLYHFYVLFNQLKATLEAYPYVDDIKSLYGLFKELLSSETVDFQGEPMKGLQIMGMLESRNLDFETVIITSVNEGVLPSGKTNSSFIPFDLKKEFNLPTYKEKDAVYTYHFYRLLQRAKRVYILYNTEADVLEGGEKSRFINQLLTDNSTHQNIKQLIASPGINIALKAPQQVKKNPQLISQLKHLASAGLSPTALSNYIRNPIDFYKRSILGIEDPLEVEETIAANTFGTIIHDILEELYLPFVNTYLSREKLEALKPGLDTVVRKHFFKIYPDSSSLSGKNLIAYNVITHYIENFIGLELNELSKHRIKIIGLEQKLSLNLEIPGIGFPITLKGKLDRIDQKDEGLRIIDYKTGNTRRSELEVVDWNELSSEYELSKAFQLLCYAFMYSAHDPAPDLKAGIVSFKNLKDGVLHFATKEKKGSRTKNITIDKHTLELFRQQLYLLITEICNPDIPFKEKEI